MGRDLVQLVLQLVDLTVGLGQLASETLDLELKVVDSDLPPSVLLLGLGELDLVHGDGLLQSADFLEVSVALTDFGLKDLVQSLDLLGEEHDSVLDLVVSVLIDSDVIELDLDGGVPLSPLVDLPLLGLDDGAQLGVPGLDQDELVLLLVS